MMARFLALFTALFLFPTDVVRAQSASEVEALRKAFVALSKEDAAGARAEVQGQSSLVRDILTWRLLRDLGDRPAVVQALFKRHPDWPQKQRLWRKAEEHLEGIRPSEIISFFDKYGAQTAKGSLYLAKAQRTEMRSAAVEMVRTAWARFPMDQALTAEYESQFGAALRAADFDRVQMLLWARETTQAEGLVPRLTARERALAEARIALQTGVPDALRQLRSLPEADRTDAGLNYDLFRYHRARGARKAALKVILDASRSTQTLGRPEVWAGPRQLLVRDAMDRGDMRLAYALAASHNLTSGGKFADLSFLSGFIALRYQSEPQLAAKHFQILEDGVNGAISKARGGYWLARAQEAMGLDPKAAYARAAQHQGTFYGQLAAETLGHALDPAFLSGLPAPVSEEDSLLRATRYFLASGQNGFAALFGVTASFGKDAQTQARIAAWAEAQNAPFVAITMAKSLSRRGTDLPASLFARHGALGSADPLALAIARKETEMNPYAISSAGARGLMQLMPGTASDMARVTGQEYSRARLTRDPAYNVSLGTAYLDFLRAEFGDSPVLLAAAYNAGPGNLRKWLRERGDPRTGDVNIIDWIERIPFSETRNYVQRVLEAETIYAARNAGVVGPIRRSEGLIGPKPVLRPLLRSDAGSRG